MRIDEFLLARIAEDEAVAREACPSPWTRSAGRVWSGASEVSAFTGTGTLDHVARWDPARVLAECAAKRAIIADIFQYEQKIDGEWGDCHTAEQIQAGECPEYGPAGTGAINGLRILASVYADHPDYQPEWAW